MSIIICVYVISRVRSDRPSVLLGKKALTLAITRSVKPIYFIHAMLIGTIHLYLSLTLTLPVGHRVSAKRDPLALFPRTLFI